MERLQAEAELINRVNSTYLVRHRSREYTEYAISIKCVPRMRKTPSCTPPHVWEVQTRRRSDVGCIYLLLRVYY